MDPNPGNNSDTNVTPVVPIVLSADLAITKTADKTSVQPGDVLTYTLTITNNGPDAAAEVTITDAVSNLLTGAESSINNGVSWLTWTGSYTYGTLAGGASITLLIRGTVSAAATGTITNTATVSSTTPDPDLSNNSSTVNVPVVVNNTADLTVVKTACPRAVFPCQTITYTIVVVNAGPDEAVNVLLTDMPPDEIRCVCYSLDDRTWYPWTGSLPLGNLAVGSSITLLLKGIVHRCAAISITNTAIVSSETPDPKPNNNQFTVTTKIRSCC